MRLFSQAPGDTHPAAAGLMPVPASAAQAYQSRGMIHGSPGTEAVAAPVPGGVPQDWSIRTRNSTSSSPVIFPALYFERGQLEHAPVSVLSDNQLPVPAIDPRGTPARALRAPVMLGQHQVQSKKRITSYPNRGG